MKKVKVMVVGGSLLLALFGFAYSQLGGPGHALACGAGWGSAGGGDYVPQRRGLSDSLASRAPALTQEQAHDVVANHIKRLNPNLRIGQVQDAGSYYEAEVLGASGDVVQRLGVDKETGRMILLN